MSYNPYSYSPGQPGHPGQPYGGYQGPPQYDASGAVRGPAISLIVVQSISVAGFLASIAYNMFLIGTRNTTFEARDAINMSGGSVVATRLAFAVVLLAVNVLILIGAIQMLRLKTYGLAMTISVLSVIPCLSGCYCLGIPFGIWSLAVLARPEVKASFR